MPQKSTICTVLVGPSITKTSLEQNKVLHKLAYSVHPLLLLVGRWLPRQSFIYDITDNNGLVVVLNH